MRMQVFSSTKSKESSSYANYITKEENIFAVSCMICEGSWSARRAVSWDHIQLIRFCTSVSSWEGISQEMRKKNPQSQSELWSESMSVVTSQAVAGRVPAVASDQQTFCCQQGGSGLGQDDDGQVTSFSSCLAWALREEWPSGWQDVRHSPLDVSKSRHS